MNEPRLVLRLGLLAQVTHIHFDDVAFTTEVVTPDTVKDDIASQYLTRVTHKQFKQLVFFGGQIDGMFTTVGAVGTGIECEVGETEDLRAAGGRGTAKQ